MTQEPTVRMGDRDYRELLREQIKELQAENAALQKRIGELEKEVASRSVWTVDSVTAQLTTERERASNLQAENERLRELLERSSSKLTFMMIKSDDDESAAGDLIAEIEAALAESPASEVKP